MGRKRRGDVAVRDLIQIAVEGRGKRGRVVGAGVYMVDGDKVVVEMGGERKVVSCSGDIKSVIEKEFNVEIEVKRESGGKGLFIAYELGE
jgi:hypothetical protein